MTEAEVNLILSNVEIDRDNLDYIKMTGEICGKLRWDLVKLFASPKGSITVTPIPEGSIFYKDFYECSRAIGIGTELMPDGVVRKYPVDGQGKEIKL